MLGVMDDWKILSERAVRLTVSLGVETPAILAALHYLDVPNTLSLLSNQLLMLDGARRLAIAHCTAELVQKIFEAERASIEAFQACLAENGSKPLDENLVCEIDDRPA